MSSVRPNSHESDVHRFKSQAVNYSEIEWQTRVDLAAAYRLVHLVMAMMKLVRRIW